MSITSSDFYFVGGTVPNNASSYITRKADQELLDALKRGQFCYVLTSRQMGKSSLLVRTIERLRRDNIHCAMLDLTAIGQNLTIERWYDGLLNMIGWQFDLEDELEAFWETHERLTPLQRLTRALQEVVLKRLSGPVVLFVDEVDAVRNLPFSADEFFAGIRECYNRRTTDPEFARLTFALFGVASPSDLIRDTRTTPFNIGRRIELTDFTLEEAAPLAKGLNHRDTEPQRVHRAKQQSGDDPSAPLESDVLQTAPYSIADPSEAGGVSGGPKIVHSRVTPFPVSAANELGKGDGGLGLLSRILYWTGGHPYLTQRLCQALAEQSIQNPKSKIQNPEVDALCADLFLGKIARDRDDNLMFVRNRLLKSEVDPAYLLDLYRRVRAGQRVPDDETNPLTSVLKLSGVVQVSLGLLCARNRIYARVFDRAWIAANMPDAELRRQRAAYRRGMMRAGSAAGLVLLAVTGLAIVAVRNAERANEKSKEAAASLRLATRSADAARQSAAAMQIERQNALKARAEAVHQAQEARAQTALQIKKTREAQEARAQTAIQARRAEQSLRASYFAQAQALRWSGRPGQKVASLALLKMTAQQESSPQRLLQLRNEAIACLALPTDLSREPLRRWPACGIDLVHQRLFEADPGGAVHIRRIQDRREIALLPALAGKKPLLTRVWRCSRDGRYVDIGYGYQLEPGESVVWDIRRRRPILRLPNDWNRVDFSPDGRTAAYDKQGGLCVGELAAGGSAKLFPTGDHVQMARFRPDGRQLAFCGYGRWSGGILDLRSGTILPLRSSGVIKSLDWRADGRYLAGGGANGQIFVWDAQTGGVVTETKRAPGMLVGDEVFGLAYNHRGDLLASVGWDNQLRLWDPAAGEQLLVCPAFAMTVEFSADDRYLAYASGFEDSIREVDTNRIYSLLEDPTLIDGTNDTAFSPDGRMLALGGRGVSLRDSVSTRRIATLPAGRVQSCDFTPDGTGLMTFGLNGLQLWPIRPGKSERERRIGPPILLDTTSSHNTFRLSRDGKLAAIVDHYDLRLVSLQGKTPPVVAGYQLGMTSPTFSPNGRWVATGSWQGRGVKVWDTSAPGKVRDLPIVDQDRALFDPGGQWLVTSTLREYRFWRVGSWQPGRSIPRPVGAPPAGCIAFTPDGSLMAITTSDTRIALIEPGSGREVAELETPTPRQISSLHFSADGSLLAANCQSLPGVELWDLGALHRQLAAVGLDWGPASPRQEKPKPRGLLSAAVLSCTQAQFSHRFLERLSAWIARSPGDIALRVQRAQLYLMTDQKPLAVADLHVAAQRTPRDAALCDRIAWTYVRRPAMLNAPQQALPFALQATRLRPDSADYLFTLALVYYRLGQPDRALETLQAELQKPGSVETAPEFFLYARIYSQQGHPDQARAAYARANQWWQANSFLLSSNDVADLVAAREETETLLGLPHSPELRLEN